MNEYEKKELKSEKDNNHENSKKGGRNYLIAGLLEETSIALLHTLKSFSNLISNLIVKKGFKHVLSRKINNNPIELQFGAN